ncbi:leucine--tRNA ligase, partial [bacterium]|nr:leucine--tRNA ligase [bacterium]
RETDTMDTFFDSSWYFARYCDPKNTSLPFDSKLADYWLPVDQYIGGIEHAVLHLLYARFFTKVTRDLGLHHQDEPAANLLCQGMVLKDGSKMSKSVGNTVDPSQIISKYGADTTRLFILFGAPVERDLDWSDAGVEGAFRFLNRVYRLATELPAYPVKNDVELDRMVHKTIKAVTEDLGRFSFNTAISRLMELVNYMYANGCNQQSAEALVLMLAPFAPMMTEELWNQFGHHSSVHLSDWPKFDAAKTIDDVVTLVMQVNGKVRDKLEVKRGMSQSEAEILVTQSERIQKFLQGQTVVKVIYVQDKLLNIVARS